MKISFVGAMSFGALACAVPGAAGCASGDATQPAEPAAAAITETQALAAGYLPTPAGLMHPDCVRRVEGDAVDAEGAQPCTHAAVQPLDDPWPRQHGWVATSWATFTDTLPTYVHAKFTVPAAPSETSGQVLFFFPSLAPQSHPPIIQPVLQWGASAAGGGNYWAIASWYVSAGLSAQYSTLERVAPGDTIDGIIAGSNCGSGACTSWTITATDVNSGVSSKLTTTGGKYAYKDVQGAVMEVYDTTACSQYPSNAGITFSSIEVRSGSTTLSPSWTTHLWDEDPSCGVTIDVSGGSTHTISF